MKVYSLFVLSQKLLIGLSTSVMESLLSPSALAHQYSVATFTNLLFAQPQVVQVLMAVHSARFSQFYDNVCPLLK